MKKYLKKLSQLMINEKFNKKWISTGILSLFSIGLFATTLFSYPQTLSEPFPLQSTATVAASTHPAENPMVAENATEVTLSRPDSPTASSEPSRGSQSSAPAQPAASQNTSSKSTNTSAPKSSTPTQNATTSSAKAPVNSSTTSSTSKATSIINTAKKYVGVPYVWGGTTTEGFDCSGYTQYVFAQHGITLPRVSRDQYNVGSAVSFSDLKAGDLVFFSLDGDKVIDHVGIFIGNGQFINASSSKGVTIYNLGSYWQSHFIGAKRVL